MLSVFRASLELKDKIDRILKDKVLEPVDTKN